MKTTKRLTAFCLSLILANFALWPVNVQAQDNGITRAQAREYILTQAAKYNPDIKGYHIMVGYPDGTLKEDNPVTLIEVMAMLSRAFGELLRPKGGLLVMAPDMISYSGIPQWAKEDMENVVDARILTRAADFNEGVTLDEIKALIQRIHTLKGESLRDDFFGAVNKEYLENTSLPPGFPRDNNFEYAAQMIDENIEAIVDEIAAGSWDISSPRQKIADFYRNYLNRGARNAQGIEPIQGYIDALKDAESLDELSDICFLVAEETAFYIFAGFAMTADMADSTKRTMVFASYGPSQTKDFYADGDKRELLLTYYENILKQAGFDAAYAKEASTAVYNLESELSAYKLDPQDYFDPGKIYNIHPFDEAVELVPNLDMDRLLSVSGLKKPDVVWVVEEDLNAQFGKLYAEEHLERLKAAAVTRLIDGMGKTLTPSLEQEAELFSQQLQGVEGELPDEYKALEKVKETFRHYIGMMYADKCFSADMKADVERMCDEFISAYKERIMGLSWMSDTTKQKAVAKLDKMRVNVGYPEKYDTETLDAAIIKSFDDGGSYYDNVISINKEQRSRAAREQFLPVDSELGGIMPYDISAHYDTQKNSINFAAGILQPPFYDKSAKKEANYGAIGAIIAHEITHAFDDSGAQFDENGNFSDWWSEEDYEAFGELQSGVIDAYDGYETFSGIKNDGVLTLGENIADLGGVACALSIVATFDNPDYDAFFRSWANVFRGVTNRQYMEYLAANDIHSLIEARVNVTPANFDAFYKTYNITQDDLLYIAPEERAGIW